MLLWHRAGTERQDGSERSFVGGRPMLPPGVAVPVFTVTDRAGDDMHIPDLPEPLERAALTSAFCERYQTFFRLIVFDGVPGATQDSASPEYTLFVANALTIFGIEAAERLIYVVPQS